MKLILCAILFIASIGLGGFALPQSKQWEYKLEYKMSEKKANALGAEGWELSAIESPSSGIGSNVPVYVFKRPK